MRERERNPYEKIQEEQCVCYINIPFPCMQTSAKLEKPDF